MIDVNKIKVGDKLRVVADYLKGIGVDEIVEVVQFVPDDYWINGGFVDINYLDGEEEAFELIKELEVKIESENVVPQKIKVLTSDHEYQGLYKDSIHTVTNIIGDIVEFKLHGKTWTLVGDEYELYEESLILDAKPDSALNKQEGGGHYKGLKIQPIEYIHANGLSYFQGNVVKYVSRYKDKNGVEDIKKAIHYLELILELEYGSK